jgi:hypothetical protein
MTPQQAQVRDKVLTVGGMLNRKLTKSEMRRQADILAKVALDLREMSK